MARSANAALMALQSEGVAFRRPWQPPLLEAWEGPFPPSAQRLPQHPQVAAERAVAFRRWRLRQASHACAQKVSIDAETKEEKTTDVDA
jgi:hypothetical protein